MRRLSPRFGDRSGERATILASAERLAEHLTDGEVRKALRPSEGRRLEVLAAYEGLTPPTPVDDSARLEQTIYVSYRGTTPPAPQVGCTTRSASVERV